MRPAQKIKIERSELREQIMSLVSNKNRTAEETTKLNELNARYASTEVEYRSAVTLQDNQIETTDIPFNNLETRASALEECWISHILNGNTIDVGAVGEYRKELGLSDDEIDVNLLIERRADVATTGPNAKATAAPITLRVFKPTILSTLGISPEMVSPAQRNYPVMTTGTTAAMRANDQVQDSTEAEFSVTELTPKQARGRTTMRTSDLAIFPQFEAALRQDLGRQIDDVVSDQIINGTGSGADVQGLTAALTEVDTPTNTVNFARFIQMLIDMVDGTYSADTSDIRLLMGVETWKLAISSQKSDESDMFALDWLRAKSMSTNLSGFIPAPTTTAGDNELNGQRLFATKSRGLSGSYGLPFWRNVQVIRDNYSDAKRGWVHITANLNWNFRITRTENWVRTILKVQ